MRTRHAHSPGLLAALLVMALLLLPGCPTTKVPQVVGLPLAAAQAAILEFGLLIGEITWEYSDTVPEGHVIRQDPLGGMEEDENTPVNLVVSDGLAPVPATVPDLRGKPQSEAETLLAQAGLAVGTVTWEHSGTVPENAVISQNPAPGAQAESGSLVDLLLSLGEQGVPVPALVGLTEPMALTALDAEGLVPGAVTHSFSDTVPPGCVISQSPTAGTPVPRGAAVAYELSRGPESAAIPELLGLLRAEAETRLAEVGFVTGVVTRAYSDTVPEGAVMGQFPAAGTAAAAGAAVDLVVSRGVEPEFVGVPFLRGLAQCDAEVALDDAGLILGTVTEAYSNTYPVGRVMDQNPAPQTQVPPGSIVAIIMSLGPEFPPVAVPDLSGMTVEAAETALTGAGLLLGTVHTMASSTVPVGLIVTQTPGAGMEMPPGTAVTVFVSSGPGE